MHPQAVPEEEYVELKKDARSTLQRSASVNTPKQTTQNAIQAKLSKAAEVTREPEGSDGVVDASSINLKSKIGMWESRLVDSPLMDYA